MMLVFQVFLAGMPQLPGILPLLEDKQELTAKGQRTKENGPRDPSRNGG